MPRKTWLASPRFVAYLVAQFLGALNDNAFKYTLLLFALTSVDTDDAKVMISSLVTALFPLPWLLVSQLAGYLADRYRKDRVLQATKVPELALMLVATLGFQIGSVPLLFVVFVLISAQSAFFSPAKYGILPEVLGSEQLAEANGVLSMTTNLAILLGTLVGLVLFQTFSDRLVLAGLVFVAIAALGTAATFFVPVAPPGSATARVPANPVLRGVEDWRALKSVDALPPTVLGLAYFALLGSLLLTVVPVYGTSVLGLTTEAAGSLLVPLVIGLAAGSLIAGWLSRGRVELGLVPLGALGMAVFSGHLLLTGAAEHVRFLGLPLGPALDFALLGVGAGVFNVPLQALLQQRSPDDRRGQLIAFSNMVGNVAILAAAGCASLLALLPGFEIQYTLFALCAITVAGTVHIVWLLPDFLVRLVVYLGMNVMYRIRVVGAENIPRGGALFVANHVSFIDALLVATGSGRMVRFMMFRPYYEARPFHAFFKRLHVIPVETGGSREGNNTSIELARAEIQAGHTVCIFAEGAITRTGNLLEFRRGLERIAGGLDAPIIPVWLDGLWGSMFSFEGGRVLKRPTRFRHPIQVVFGAPLPSSATAFEVRQAVQALSVDAVELREREFRTLPFEILRSARRNFSRPLWVDAAGRRMSHGGALLRALALRDRLRAAGVRSGDRLALLVPDDARGALASLGALCAGAVPINLPVNARSAAERALRDARVERALCLRSYRDALGWSDLAGVREWLEIDPEPAAPFRGPAAPFRGPAALRVLALRLLPARAAGALLLDVDARAVRAMAAVVFSRGTSAPPKAVELSHFNLLANVRAFRQVFDLDPTDTILGIVPLAHVLGFTGTLCLPVLAGVRVVLVADSLDVATLERVARAERPSVIFATPALLERYVANLAPDALGGLRSVITGGAPLSPELRRRFEARFGIAPLEGYGMSECAPLVSLNLPDAGRDGAQRGSREGTFGHPLPGIAVRVVDPELGTPLPPGADGRLRVRGPNVMAGYLGDGARLSTGEWYDTGDVARLDAAGFLTVLDRAGRVLPHPQGDIPLSRLEEALCEALPDELASGREPGELFAVVALRGVPAVLYVQGAVDPDALFERLRTRGLPPHWLPARAGYHAVPSLPRFETGHVDRERAAALLAPRLSATRS
jgi:acyl-[acyl-carrier-protein]-phospholipid O-acyltransferase / long-chain-fatty-acid--[acyl-carrier-protein] ligase